MGLADDQRVRKALETWQPGYIDWWKAMGPEGFQNSPVYLRTAVGVGSEGWAKFGFVKMPEYRWGIFLAEPVPDIGAGSPLQLRSLPLTNFNGVERANTTRRGRAR